MSDEDKVSLKEDEHPLVRAFCLAVNGDTTITADQADAIVMFMCATAPSPVAHYLAVLDRSLMTDAEYARRSKLPDELSEKIDWEAPKQDLYKAAGKVMLAFLGGKINPYDYEFAIGLYEAEEPKIQAFSSNLTRFIDSAHNLGIDIDVSKIFAEFKATLDVPYVGELLNFVKENTDESGVVTLGVLERSLLKAMIADGLSPLKRLMDAPDYKPL